MKKHIYILLIILWLITSCGTSDSASPLTDTPITAETAAPINTDNSTSTPQTTATLSLSETKTPNPSENATHTDTPTTTATPSSVPPFSGSGGGVLAFVRTHENGWGIYIMNADGSDERQILNHGQALAYPEWSPDGSQIAFHKHQSNTVWSINVMDADGRNERRLTHTEARDAAPVWSPDGTKIAFSRDGDILVMSADGNDQKALTDDLVFDNVGDWSPDGSQIVFTSESDGNTEIFIMAADGSNRQRLTNNAAEDWWPVWSPENAQGEEQIAFMSNRDGDWEIYVMNTSGESVRQLTDNTTDDSGPAWSPDGEQIAFSSNRDTAILYDTEIYIMNANGSNQQRITEKAGMEWGIDWQPAAAQESNQTESTPQAETAELPNLRITIIYDNYLYDERLTQGWGFSALVEYGDHVLLFDTGGSGETLLNNMELLGIEPKMIETVVISHEHGDHTGGLISLLEVTNRPTVYMLASSSAALKNRVASFTDVIEVTESIEIIPGIYSTGKVISTPPEQGLAIQTESGIVIITGCAHPGISRMVHRGRSAVQPGSEVVYGPVALVIGGYHMAHASSDQVERVIADLRSLGVVKVCPTHCTGDTAIAMFAEAFGDDYIQGGAGQVINIP
ncbi:MAG: MBL fold metallo-hydrolase [Chloroflexota bacterium]|nr:MBL fold metallo-hydrolase [Chloroflexota bacterium]